MLHFLYPEMGHALSMFQGALGNILWGSSCPNRQVVQCALGDAIYSVHMVDLIFFYYECPVVKKSVYCDKFPAGVNKVL